MNSLDPRAAQLREFLIKLRSRLKPQDVGLQPTARRRVPGLRREEVAELAGVSAIWYRWFESGRAINVSQQFLAALSFALRMNQSEKSTLYHLAIKDLYGSDGITQGVIDALTPPPVLRRLVTSIDSPAQIDTSVNVLAAARERFLSGAERVGGAIRPRILSSWKRSRQRKIDAVNAGNLIVASNSELSVLRDANSALLSAARPVISHLADRLLDDGYAVILTDAQGQILELAAESALRRRLADIGIEPGTHMGEGFIGTNGIGTAIEDGRALQIVGPEHFWEPWHDLMCNGVPVREPHTGRVLGVLDITADFRLARAELMAAMLEYAYAIEENLATPHLL